MALSNHEVSAHSASELTGAAGAADGTNPFVYYADRSLYGIGGGLFQRPGAGQKVPDRWKGQLRPIALWSKSLDRTQRNWTVWEGELFAVREGLFHTRDICAGCHIIVCTDRLNNLVSASTELRQPAKVLRWLQEISSLGIITWAFTPGTANVFADAMSRLVPLLSQVAMDQLKGSGLPKNLQEAFLQAVENPDTPMAVVPVMFPPSKDADAANLAVKCRRVLEELRGEMANWSTWWSTMGRRTGWWCRPQM